MLYCYREKSKHFSVGQKNTYTPKHIKNFFHYFTTKQFFIASEPQHKSNCFAVF